MSKLITKCEMDWEVERHKFIFHTGGSRIEALDSLGDLIGSLEELYKYFAEDLDCWGEDLPHEFKVIGGSGYTKIEEKK